MSRDIWALSWRMFRAMSLKLRYQEQLLTPEDRPLLPAWLPVWLPVVEVDIFAARPEAPDMVSQSEIFSCTRDWLQSPSRWQTSWRSPCDFRRGASSILRSSGAADLRRGFGLASGFIWLALMLSDASCSDRSCSTWRGEAPFRLEAELCRALPGERAERAELLPGSSQTMPLPCKSGLLFSLSGLPEVSLKACGTVLGEFTCETSSCDMCASLGRCR
mmetsp:Transcript_15666/g.37163  ORF Transcript_15666/g.37163 Transcript_15666/m.37163 type:complete len:218 (+) Transcript_15666:1305-1958(+)